MLRLHTLHIGEHAPFLLSTTSSTSSAPRATTAGGYSIMYTYQIIPLGARIECATCHKEILIVAGVTSSPLDDSVMDEIMRSALLTPMYKAHNIEGCHQ